jgi:RNA polymerase primary sigma factor
MKINEINPNLISKEKLQSLTPRRQKIIQLYFGLNGFKKHNLQEIGKIIGISRQRVSQIIRRALMKMEIYE